MNETRCNRLIRQAIDKFELDLSNRIVLTEAATGYYILTPLIAALSGAERVYAMTRDSRFGAAADISRDTLDLAKKWGLENSIQVLTYRDDTRIGDADIVTNLGFVRPLDAHFLRRLKGTAVIPLMWETWEFRCEDLDLKECRRLGICVLGTNERHPELQIFTYIGGVAMKALFEQQIEIFRSRVVVVGGGWFAEQIMIVLGGAGAYVSQFCVGEGRLASEAGMKALEEADAVIVVEHQSRNSIIGESGELTAKELYKLNPALLVVHICGNVDYKELSASGLRCYPQKFAPPGYMSLTTDYIGPKPLVDLHVAGLKVGQEMAQARSEGLTALDAETAVLKRTSLAQGFTNYHHPET